MPPKRTGVPRKSCDACFHDRKKCVRSPEPGPCERCARLNRECVFGAQSPASPSGPSELTDRSWPLESSEPADDVAVADIASLPGVAAAAQGFIAAGASPPVIHRTTLASPPPTLILAMAAMGASELSSARLFAGAATDRVLAGLAADSLETAQTVVLLLHFTMFRSMSAAIPPLLVAGRAALASLCLDSSGGFSREMREPSNVEEWIIAESALRCWCVFSSLDNGANSHFGDAALFDATACPAPLPAHESFFDSADPHAAFEELRAAGAFGPGRFVDFSAFARTPVFEAASGPIRHIVRSIFEQRASCVAVYSIHAFMRSMRGKLRGFARDRGIEPLAIMGKEREQLTADELTYCDALDLTDDLTRAFFASMPEGVGGPFLAGDAAPLLSDSIFMSPAIAQIFFALSFVILATWVEAAADPLNGQSDTPVSEGLFGSHTFVRILDRAQVLCDLLESLRDEDLPLLYPAVGLASVRVGLISLTLFDILQGDAEHAATEPVERLRRNVEYVARVLASIGTDISPALAKLNADFFRAARAAGALGEEFPGSPLSEVALEEVQAEFTSPEGVDRSAPAAALSRALGQLDRGLTTWVPRLEDWARAASGELHA
ncbi:hypothetical protein DFJ74DRAFT_51317 [Hyaloraphidium curvatum]|nr:hypothetical protein DFJ74DRAFT_51317 [Hyaloraphidium curvatum]